jgi:hypothetical protein
MADPFFRRPDPGQRFGRPHPVRHRPVVRPVGPVPGRAPAHRQVDLFARDLEDRRAAVLYVDLWTDKALEPGLAVVSLVRSALAQDDGAVLKMFARRAWKRSPSAA